jgi:hypothetical protein
MDRYEKRWSSDRQLRAVRTAALICVAIAFAAIAVKAVPLG